MTSFIKSVKAGGRGAVIALVLGATSMVAMPAPVMAQSFSFEFPIAGGEGSVSFGIGPGGVRVRRACMRQGEIRDALRDQGWRDIRFVDRDGNWVQVIAEWENNDRDYSMWINRCTGKVRDIERVRRRSGPGGGITLQFSY